MERIKDISSDIRKNFKRYKRKIIMFRDKKNGDFIFTKFISLKEEINLGFFLKWKLFIDGKWDSKSFSNYVNSLSFNDCDWFIVSEKEMKEMRMIQEL